MRWPDLVFIKELIVKSGMKWNDLVNETLTNSVMK